MGGVPPSKYDEQIIKIVPEQYRRDKKLRIDGRQSGMLRNDTEKERGLYT